MATLKDIALEAGVSVMTVSNVIHNRTEKVSPETIDKVNAIIKKLDYTPNLLARSLVSNSSKVVAYVTTIDLSDPFCALFTEIFERELSKSGYYLMIKKLNSSRELKSFLLNWNIDGIVFTGIYKQDFVDVIHESKVPAVFVDSYFSSDHIVNIGLDDFGGGYIAAKYLIEKGHSELGIVSCSSCSLGVAKIRLDGFKKAMEDYGLSLNPDYVFDNCYNDENISAAAQSIQKNNITAISAIEDITAINVMKELVNIGLTIPDDVSIMGFDDIDLASLTMPRLTTVHQDFNKKCSLAADYLLKMLRGEAKPDNIILPVHIIERNTILNKNNK